MEGGFPPGTVLLEKYRVESVLGRGGMGVVLRVTHLHLGEELAIKILLPEAGGGSEVHARFLREAQSAVRLRGEHVARVGDVGVLPGGAPYMVMEYLRGGDLSGELARRRALPAGEVVDYVLQACEALAEAHALGIIHRDIKPSNLFLTRRPDGSPLVKVLDFGISKAPVGGPGVLTRTDTVMGTPGYMSLEQMKASKDVDARADIWALGIVLYECLNGRRPFDAVTFSAIVVRAATEPPPPMDPRIHRGLQGVILRCLEKDRAARFPSIAALAAALAPFARDARSAGIIVERTAAMLQGPGAAVSQPARFGQSREATTLSGSAGMMRVRSTRRYTIGAVVVVLAVILALSVVGVTVSHEGQGVTGSAGFLIAAKPSALGLDAAAKREQTTAVYGATSVPDAAEVAVMVDAAIAPMTPETAVVASTGSGGVVVDTKARAKARAKVCADLEVTRQWQDLKSCASELAVLGGHDRSIQGKAEEFHVKAVKEAANALAAGKVKKALAEGNLREARKQLQAIGPDSMYLSETSDAFRTAEVKAIDENRLKAQALVAAKDCVGIKRLQAEVNATGTTTVSSAVATLAAECVDRALSQPDPTAGGAVDGHVPPPASKDPCDTLNIDDAMLQAQNQYAAGFAQAALQLIYKALVCRQDIQMYRLAATYACAARYLNVAKLYYSKVPAQFQGAIAQRCQMEGLDLGHSTSDTHDQELPQPQHAQSDVRNVCDTMDVEALLSQAANQYKAGSPNWALAIVVRALSCKKDIRMFRMAAMYACTARDKASAQRYYGMLSPSYQPAIKDRCAQYGIEVVP